MDSDNEGKSRGSPMFGGVALVLILTASLGGLEFAKTRAPAYDERSQTAAVVDLSASASGNSAGTSKTGTCDYKTQSCKCNADRTTSDSADSVTQQCLPGCTYTVTAATQSGASTDLTPKVSTDGMSTAPDATTGKMPSPLPNGTIKFCDMQGGHCSTKTCTPGDSLDKKTLTSIQTTAAVTSILSNPSDAANQVRLFAAQGGDLSALSDALNTSGTQNGLSGLDSTQQAGISSAQSQLDKITSASGDEIGAGSSCLASTDTSASCESSNGKSLDLNSNLSQTQQSLGCVNGYCYQQTTDATQANKLEEQGYSCDQESGYYNCSTKQTDTTSGDTKDTGNGDDSNKKTNTFQGPCQAGQTQTATGCSSASGNGADTTNSGGILGGLGNVLKSLGSGLGSLAQGVAQGLASGLASSNCNSQYSCSGSTLYYKYMSNNSCQQQTVQYCSYGCASSGTSCALSSSQTATYGTGSDGAACPQPQSEPTSGCTSGTWKQTSQSNGCPYGWQCVPNSSDGGTTTTTVQPTAQISCQPTSADVGMAVTISYSCDNATTSSGSGFTTSNQLSGSTTTVITTPPSGTNNATYSLGCTNSSKSDTAQCSVQINQPAIVLTAVPSTVAPGGESAIGWVTSGMQSCVISSPDSSDFTTTNANNKSINGVATTSPIYGTTRFDLQCTSVNGTSKSAEVSVGVSTSTAAMSVSTDAGSSISLGDTVTISWQTSSTTSAAAVSLWLVDVSAGTATRVIAGAQSLNGTYRWSVPSSGDTCNQSASNVCASDLVSGKTYAIEAVLYSPLSAYVGDGTPPSSPVSPTYGASAISASFTAQ